MNLKLALLAGTFAFTGLAHASNVLPDSCGDTKTRFSIVKSDADGKIAGPAEGKARLVLAYPVIWSAPHWGGKGTGGGDLRVGMDGNWIGAAESATYFTVEIAPGEHHLCVTEYGAFGRSKQDGIAMGKFNAEAGKTYFYEYKLNFGRVGDVITRDVSFSMVDEDEGRFQVKALKVSDFTQKK